MAISKERKQFIARVKGALAEHGPTEMQPLSYGAPQESRSDSVLSEIESRVREDADLGNQLGTLAYNLTQQDQFEDALRLFERLIDAPGLHKSVYNNALWAVMDDNNKMPVQHDRARRFLDACLPHGPDNPSIFYNAACAYFELDEINRVYEQLQLAIEHDYPRPEQMRAEPLFAPIADDPRFVAIFEAVDEEP